MYIDGYKIQCYVIEVFSHTSQLGSTSVTIDWSSKGSLTFSFYKL